MPTQPRSVTSTRDDDQARPRPAQAWHQAGHPRVYADTADGAVYPYVLYVGDYAPIRIPMTTAGVRALRESLTALLATTPAEPADFVAEWAAMHGAAIYLQPIPCSDDAEAAPDRARVVSMPSRALGRRRLSRLIRYRRAAMAAR